MTSFAHNFSIFLGVMTIAANLLAIALIATHTFPRLRTTAFARLFTNKALPISFVVAFLATAGSLIYSDVIGFEPCKLCWFQRIFMYPLVVVFGVAIWRMCKKTSDGMEARILGLWLSVIGGAVALFHYLGQRGWNPFELDCLAVGQSVSCSKQLVLTLGYVTIPLMAFSAFALIALTLWLSIRADKKQ